jgi:hypothetical protein
MKILIDGKENNSALKKSTQSSEMLSSLKSDLQKQSLHIATIDCDGEVFDASKIVKDKVDLMKYKTVNITTKSTALVMEDSLKEIVANLPGLFNTLNQVCSLLRDDKTSEATDLFAKTTSFMQLLILGIVSIQQYKKDNLGINVAELSAALKDASQTIYDADYVLFCDIVEYRIITQFQEIQKVITTLISAKGK